MTHAKTAPFGTWDSPISAKVIAAQGETSGIEDVLIDIDTSKVYFAQNRPEEGGRSCIVSVETGADIIPREFDARTKVHEYGGAASIVRNGVVYFSNMADNRVYTTTVDDKANKPKPVTPVSAVKRYASFSVHPQHSHLLLATCEDHVDEGWHPWRVRTYIVLIDASTSTVNRVWTGTETPKGKGEKKDGIDGDGGEGMGENDFFAYAQWSEDGKRVLWQQWAHPELPWQSASIYVASITLGTEKDKSTSAKVSNVHHVSGEHGKISSLDPKWLSPTTGIFVSDEGGWANPFIFILDPNDETAQPRVERAVKGIIHEEFGGPQWWLSRTYSAALSNNKAVFTSIREGRSILSVFDFSLPIEKRERVVADDSFAQILYVRGNGHKGVFLGQNATRGDELTEIIIESTDTIVRPLLPPEPPHPVLRPEYISPPIYKLLHLGAVPEADLPKRVCHVTFYAPQNPQYSGGKDGEKPPVIVLIHGGPFFMETSSLDWTKQFWTSRGWAHVDINYGGSTGFGRAYRESLHKHWGILDINDAHASVLELAKLGLVDANRAAIYGGSAGGYTTLQAATTLPDAFAVGSPLFGISDMQKLDAILHKQEYFLCDRLMGGPYSECPEIWKARSPIFHVDKVKMPMLAQQGEIDTVVPVAQMEDMVNTLKKNGNDAELVIFEGEGHFWRKAVTIQASLEKQLEYFKRVLKL